MEYKKAIYEATTKEEVAAVELVYELPVKEDTQPADEESTTTEETTESGDTV